ncbi:MAG: tetratricopeptide (TPR) repeat protein [Bacillariaceae sp.]|jgi:tetratricopeptide (TPR) repeat protein
MSEFTSEGFDLDAVGKDSGEDVIFEIGGGATVVPVEEPHQQSSPSSSTPSTPISKAEEWKQRGNEEFKKKNYLEAYDMYTEAIDACPCPVDVEEILRQRDEFDEMEREKARSRMEEETKQRRRNDDNDGKEENSKETSPSSKKIQQQQQQQQQGPATFELSHQEHGDKLAIFLNNRAATNILLERFEDAIKDADVALILNPIYARAYIRRSSAFEKTERTEEALRDIKRALEIEPSNANIRKSAMRLQKIEDERLEKLKVREKMRFMRQDKRKNGSF